MSLLFGFLTFILVVNCLFLILLVLVQLPKKEAGAGLAFGGGAVDTLIGAGSGNALTKITKYAAASFLGLAVVLAMLNAQRHNSGLRLQQELARKSGAGPALPVQPAPAAAPLTGALATNTVAPDSDLPSATSTDAPPALQLEPLVPGTLSTPPATEPAPAVTE